MLLMMNRNARLTFPATTFRFRVGIFRREFVPSEAMRFDVGFASQWQGPPSPNNLYDFGLTARREKCVQRHHQTNGFPATNHQKVVRFTRLSTAIESVHSPANHLLNFQQRPRIFLCNLYSRSPLAFRKIETAFAVYKSCQPSDVAFLKSHFLYSLQLIDKSCSVALDVIHLVLFEPGRPEGRRDVRLPRFTPELHVLVDRGRHIVPDA